MSNSPQVSVIIPTFNRFDSLKLAIQSVLNQTFNDFEIIVINDCSTQSEYYNGELEQFPKTTVIHLPVNLRTKYNTLAAQGKTREEGINVSKGTWLCFLDDDDYWYPNKLEIQFNQLANFPDILFCSSNMECGYGVYHSDIVRRLYHNHELPQIFDLDIITRCNYINNSTVILHRSIYNMVGEFKIGNCEDYDYWLRSLQYTKCLYISQPLIYYDLGHNNGKLYR